MTLLGAHVALCQANKNFTNSKPIFCKCGFLTNRRNFLSLVATERFFNKKKISRIEKYSIKIVSILLPLDYVFGSLIRAVESRLVQTSLVVSSQKRDSINETRLLNKGLKTSPTSDPRIT